MLKYDLLKEQLEFEGLLSSHDFFHPHGVDAEVAALTHSRKYIDGLLHGNLSPSEIRRIGFPYSPELIEREFTIMGGTLECAWYALDHGIGLNIAGGTHHAFHDHGEGFCLLNDFAIAINHLLHHKKIKRALIIDLDVHQGNGTAAIFKKRSEVFTFSMHGEKNYPMHKEVSDIDIELPDGTSTDAYLNKLEAILPELFDQAVPDIVCYQSGVDILSNDKLGRLAVSIDGCRQRDKMVFESSFKRGVPVVCAMGGGYSKEIRTIVDAHANTFRMAKHIWD